MCVACIEYMKGVLNEAEFKSALKETTMEDPKHLREVEEIIRENAANPEELKRKLNKSSGVL